MAKILTRSSRTFGFRFSVWMVSELNLSGNELLVYSIIYGYTKEGGFKQLEKPFIAECIGSGVSTVKRVFNSLADQDLIEIYNFSTPYGVRSSVRVKKVKNIPELYRASGESSFIPQISIDSETPAPAVLDSIKDEEISCQNDTLPCQNDMQVGSKWTGTLSNCQGGGFKMDWGGVQNGLGGVQNEPPNKLDNKLDINNNNKILLQESSDIKSNTSDLSKESDLKASKPLSIDEVEKFLREKNITTFSAIVFWNWYDERDWKISNWRNKALEWDSRKLLEIKNKSALQPKEWSVFTAPASKRDKKDPDDNWPIFHEELHLWVKAIENDDGIMVPYIDPNTGQPVRSGI